MSLQTIRRAMVLLATLALVTGMRAQICTGGEPQNQIKFSNPVQLEGNSGNHVIVVTAERCNPLLKTEVQFTPTAAGASAFAGSDYGSFDYLHTFDNAVAGGNTFDMNITVFGDTVIEANEVGRISPTCIFNLNPGWALGQCNVNGSFTLNNDDFSPTEFTIGDAELTEGNAGSQTMTFHVTRTQNFFADTIDVATADNTATAGSDYVASGPFTFMFSAGGDFTKTTSVVVNGDTDPEPHETFFVNLSNAVIGNTNGGSITDPQGVGTILSDDAVQTQLSISDVTLAEGDAGNTAFTFTITRSQDLWAESVKWATADGTALAGVDYTAVASTTVNFTVGGPLTQDVTVQVSGDTDLELDETFFVNLSDPSGTSPVGTVLSDGQGLGTIDSDDTTDFSIDDVVADEGDAGTKTFTFTVSRNANTFADSVDVATSDGTATTADSDYDVVATTTLNFSAGGVTSQTVDVTVNGDTTVELDETFDVDLSTPVSSNPAGVTLADATGQGTITNDDNSTISLAPDAGNEGGTLGLQVTFSNPVDTTVSFQRQTLDGTATTADSDYTALTAAPLNVTAAQTATGVTINVNTTTDSKVELDEAFTLQLSALAPAGRAVTFASGGATQTADGTITNDDSATLSVGDLSQSESTPNFLMPVSITAPVDVAVTLTVTPSTPGSASPGVDYDTTPRAVTFPAGSSVGQTALVTVMDDAFLEARETFTATPSGLGAGGRAVTLGASGTGTILDADVSSDPRDLDGDEMANPIDADRDGDGVEDAADPGPGDRTDNGGALGLPGSSALSLESLLVRKRFDVGARDRFQVEGRLRLPTGFVANGAAATVTWGEVNATAFTLDPEGKARDASGDVRLDLDLRGGSIQEPGWTRFSMIASGATFVVQDATGTPLAAATPAVTEQVRPLRVRIDLTDTNGLSSNHASYQSILYTADAARGLGELR